MIFENFVISNDDDKDFFLVNNSWNMDDPKFGNNHTKCSICDGSKLPFSYSYLNNNSQNKGKNNKTFFCLGHFGKLDLKMYIIHPLFNQLYKRLCKEYPVKSSSLGKQRKAFPDRYKGIIFKFLPVPHLNIRNNSDIEWTNKLTVLYNNLVELVKVTNPNRKKIESIIKKIFSKEGILGLLSTKEGVFRKLAFGKRLESSARSVITGDPNIDIDQVHIPKYLSKFLYIECIIDSDDIEYCLEKNVPLTKDQAIKGIKAMRKIVDNDLVLINRQPTLSYGSILAFRVKIREDDNKTIGINPNVTKTFNADFDGDEMNIFCFPQCDDLEKMRIINFPECINSIQDTVLAKYIFGDLLVSVSTDLQANEKDDKKYKNVNNIELLKSNLEDNQDIEKDLKENTEKNIELYKKLTDCGLSISLSDMINGKYLDTDLYKIIESKSKGNLKNKEQIMDKIGNQYVSGNLIGTIDSNYVKGLNQDDFFTHQMAAREGIVSTGVNTSTTGYINRKTTKSMADVILSDDIIKIEDNEYKIIRDYKGIISYMKI